MVNEQEYPFSDAYKSEVEYIKRNGSIDKATKQQMLKHLSRL